MQWGNWTLNPQNFTLVNEAVGGYEIDLEKVQSSAGLLDWIFQVRSKPWADSITMSELLSAFQDIFDPQAHFCSAGRDSRADGGKLAKDYITNQGNTIKDWIRADIRDGRINVLHVDDDR